ncbi:transposase [Streptomyces humicola]|uniref:transposase n=1 Tax=Streptomyces humicola TaxID=2953240 RepID=UPI0035589453
MRKLSQIALRSSKTISEVARELELNPETLRGWVKKYQNSGNRRRERGIVGERAGSSEGARTAQRELEMEVAFRKRATAYLAKDPQQRASTSSSMRCDSAWWSTRTASGSCATGSACPEPATTTGDPVRNPWQEVVLAVFSPGDTAGASRPGRRSAG